MSHRFTPALIGARAIGARSLHPGSLPVAGGDRVRGRLYNGLHQLITRVVTNSGSLDGTTHYVHDRSGNVIAELNAAGATVREYIWLPRVPIVARLSRAT